MRYQRYRDQVALDINQSEAYAIHCNGTFWNQGFCQPFAKFDPHFSLRRQALHILNYAGSVNMTQDKMTLKPVTYFHGPLDVHLVSRFHIAEVCTSNSLCYHLKLCIAF